MKKGMILILSLSFVFFFSCLLNYYETVTVYVNNQTTDNFTINEGGPHVMQGTRKFLTVLSKNNPKESFNLCRSYGCLAKVTLSYTEIEEEEFEYIDTIFITEDPKNTFHASQGRYIFVHLENFNE